MTRFAVDVRRQDVDCADNVPVEHATASRASIDASAGLLPLPTHGACLGRVVLILQHDLDPDMLGLVRDVLAQPPMRPARHLLVRSVSQVDAIGHVPHVANDDLACTPGHCMIDHGPTTLCRMSLSRRSCWALKRFIRFWMRFRLFDPRFFRSRKEASSDRRLLPYCLQALQRPAGEHQGLLGVRYDGRVDFAHVDRQHPVSRCGWRDQTVFEHHVPGVLVGLLVEHKPGFQNPTGTPKRREGHRDRSQAPARARSRVLPLLRMPVFFQIVVLKPRRCLGYRAAVFPFRLRVLAVLHDR